jgi:hypothetical protein
MFTFKGLHVEHVIFWSFLQVLRAEIVKDTAVRCADLGGILYDRVKVGSLVASCLAIEGVDRGSLIVCIGPRLRRDGCQLDRCTTSDYVLASEPHPAGGH